MGGGTASIFDEVVRSSDGKISVAFAPSKGIYHFTPVLCIYLLAIIEASPDSNDINDQQDIDRCSRHGFCVLWQRSISLI